MKDIIEIDFNNPDIYKEKVWGNTEEVLDFVNKKTKEFDGKIIGEVFLVSTHSDGLSRFTNGNLLKDEIYNEESVFGKTVGPKGEFPLLLKVLSAQEFLSVQTHYKNKTEAWHTLSDGEMLYGLTKTGEEILQTTEGREKLSEVMKTAKTVEEVSEYFNYVKFKVGETYLIHAGMVHSLLSGTMLEPQKNSNLTIRGGDWGRNDPNRLLQTEDFFASIHPYATKPKPIEPKYKTYRTDKETPKNSKHACLVATSDFALDKISLKDGSRMLETFTDRFFIVIVIEGDIDLTNGVVHKKINKGQIFVLGATSNEWTFTGTGEIMLVYVPHLKKGVITPLRNNDYSYEEIAAIGGPTLKENDVYIQMKELGLI
jgi:mannose-6-phosphate isomerase class I